MPTVAEILDLEIFKEAAAEVVAGRCNLGAQVRWVHIGEMLDIAHLLKGGELLLSTGMQLGGLGSRQYATYAAELRNAGAAGLVIELGTRLKVLPKRLVEEAEQQGLPLIALHREIRYVEVTEQVHASIISQHYKLLERADEIARSFTELLLQGVSLGHIVHRLAAIVGNPVFLEDSAHQIMEFAPDSGSATQIVGEWQAHSWQAHTSSPDSMQVRIEQTAPPCAWLPITVRDRVWGRLHMVMVDKVVDELDKLALDRTAATVSLSLLVDSSVVHWSEQARDALIFDILRGRYVAGPDVVRRASAAGADLSGKHLAVAVIDPAGLADVMDERSMSEVERQQLRNVVLTCVRDAVVAARGASVAALDGDRVIALVGLPGSGPGSDLLTLVASDAAGRISRSVVGVRPVVGLSHEVEPDSVRRGLDEARIAAHRGRVLPGAGPVHRYGDVGIESLLVRIADGPDLARFVEAELGPLLANDAGSTPLLPTLRTYLEKRNVKAAAYALGVERRSLYHRLARITDLLGHDLDDADVRAQLWLALRGLEILRARHSVAAKASASDRPGAT